MLGQVAGLIPSISIHALLAESDLKPYVSGADEAGFLSTLSLRRATRFRAQARKRHKISIHALLAESDASGQILGHFLSISIHALLAESDHRLMFLQNHAS